MSDFSYAKHAHEEYSIGVTLKGRQDFFCQKAFHKSPSGGVLLFNPEDVHDGHSGGSENLEYVMLYIHPNELKPLFQALGYGKDTTLRLDSPLMDDAVLRHQILSMHQLVSEPNHSTIEFESGLFHIAQSLVAKAGKLDQEYSPPLSRKDSLLTRAKDFIIGHIDQDISIDDVANAATMSKYHFIRLFHRQFGITPHQYVLNCRINAARKYLESGLPSSHVAQLSGFADNSHLNRHFKRTFGMTPKQYQLQLCS
uniref:AraC family transcriptional regulator n=2 Tax=Vibrio ziniensis TaxID=2711221 RepID=A0A6G7CMF4_9VIBR|nr:AraC family transcriptional regulator [Vibrio ziniensis]